MKRRAIRVLLIVSIVTVVSATLWNSLPEKYSAINELAFEPVPAPPDKWQNIDEYKWGIRFRIPPGLTERYDGNLWIHENESFNVIVDFGPDSLVSYISDKVQLKTHGLKRNYAQTIVTRNGLKTLICSYEKTGKDKTLLRAVELIYLENRKHLGAPREPSYRVEYKSENDQQLAMQILQSVNFLNP